MVQLAWNLSWRDWHILGYCIGVCFCTDSNKIWRNISLGFDVTAECMSKPSRRFLFQIIRLFFWNLLLQSCHHYFTSYELITVFPGIVSADTFFWGWNNVCSSNFRSRHSSKLPMYLLRILLEQTLLLITPKLSYSGK